MSDSDHQHDDNDMQDATSMSPEMHDDNDGQLGIIQRISGMSSGGSPISPDGGQAPRKRKKNANGGTGPSEPRRLRRSHEACARCRSKKIKCDSKHPRCTACASAGQPCVQEDRHRRTLTPRGHVDTLERQLAQCDALLKLRIPDFDMNDLDEICAREGVQVNPDPNMMDAVYAYRPNSPRVHYPPQSMSPDGKPYPFSPQMQSPTAYANGQTIPYALSPGGLPPQPGYPPYFINGLHPEFQPHVVDGERHQHQHRPTSSGGPSHDIELKGQDPQSNDMSSTHALARTFGVSSAIMNETSQFSNSSNDREDLAVGSGALTSGRDKNNIGDYPPRVPSLWIDIQLRTGGTTYPTATIWLPRDRILMTRIVDVYFTRLNSHRPVFTREEFTEGLEMLYAQENFKGKLSDMALYDPGFVCSLYLVFALGTLSELSHKAAMQDTQIDDKSSITAINELPKILLPPEWPEHSEFFDRALIVKSDLRITVSSLQALILLHWYLYIERQGRSLWRLVGHLVRLSTELGLHHDPIVQAPVFNEAECQLRIRLWAIVMIHDRGTSILLGRPLAIAPSDSNTPRPQHRTPGTNKSLNYSDHFVQSAGLVDIQADIINSLYTPIKQAPDAIMRHARRITKSLVEFRNQLPESYQMFFVGSDHWPRDKKAQLVQNIIDDNGLTLLKYWIARILMLRVLFSYTELGYNQRLTALTDAIQTAHNIIMAHNSLTKFPDVGFFVSPIPIHIASMVILYGHMSKVNCLDRSTALEDVWAALTMLPRLRWRWERKDLNGEHPLIAKLAEKVFEVKLEQSRPTRLPRLIPEMIWDDSVPQSPVHSNSSAMPSPVVLQPLQPPVRKLVGQQTQKTVNGAQYAQGQHRPPVHVLHSPVSPQNGSHPFLEIPAAWFYPASDVPFGGLDRAGEQSAVNQETETAISMVLPVKSEPRPLTGSIGCEESNVAYLNEERDESLLPTHMNPWVQHMEKRSLAQLWPQHAESLHLHAPHRR